MRKSEICLEDLLSTLCKVGDWIKAPPQAIGVVNQLEEEYGGNISIGNHPEIGWFVLLDQGYGIDLVWSEYDLELPCVQNTI